MLRCNKLQRSIFWLPKSVLQTSRPQYTLFFSRKAWLNGVFSAFDQLPKGSKLLRSLRNKRRSPRRWCEERWPFCNRRPRLKCSFQWLKKWKKPRSDTLTINYIVYCNRYRSKLQYISEKNWKFVMIHNKSGLFGTESVPTLALRNDRSWEWESSFIFKHL